MPNRPPIRIVLNFLNKTRPERVLYQVVRHMLYILFGTKSVVIEA